MINYIAIFVYILSRLFFFDVWCLVRIFHLKYNYANTFNINFIKI